MSRSSRLNDGGAKQFWLGSSSRCGNISCMPNSAEALRRWLGLFCLAMAAGMLIWGQTILKPHLDGVPFIIYWAFCFLFTIAAVVIALLDVRAVRLRIKEEKAELVARTLREIENEKEIERSKADR
jgi:hypothetical protein